MNLNISASLPEARYVVFGGVLVLIAFNLFKIGWFLGLLAVTVPLAWQWVFLWLNKSKFLSPSSLGLSTSESGSGHSQLMAIALCMSVAALVAPVFVYFGEALNDSFGAIAGGDLLTYFVLRAGVVEELLKFSAVLIVVKYLAPQSLTRPVDGIVLACAAALGFAVYENFYHNLYLLDAQGGFKAFLLGTFIRVPIHALYGAIWGAAFGISRFLPVPQRYVVLCTGLASSMFVHGLWDTMAQSKTLFVFALMLLLYGALWYGYTKLWSRVEAIELVSGENHE
ncbi:PrsW family intramembrane metalloprotease [bacterium]|nr:PrsW family intramembrane metalloprotease [bacterium]MBP9810540.1 PrsW family intramembrane metalloprotease [bacterium]